MGVEDSSSEEEEEFEDEYGDEEEFEDERGHQHSQGKHILIKSDD
jgi:hypothetical protein